MRKNKTMKGGWTNSGRRFFGSMLGNNNNTQFGRNLFGNTVNSGIGPATSNRRRSAMNPVGVSMPKNLFGFAKSTPGMSMTERIRRGVEHVNEMTKDDRLAKSIDNNPFARNVGNSIINALNKDRGISRG